MYFTFCILYRMYNEARPTFEINNYRDTYTDTNTHQNIIILIIVINIYCSCFRYNYDWDIVHQFICWLALYIAVSMLMVVLTIGTSLFFIFITRKKCRGI